MKNRDLKTFQTISASSITTFLSCPRKWWFRYILGEREPSTESMKHGTRVHEDIEAYLKGEKKKLETIEAQEARSREVIPMPCRVNNDLVERSAASFDLKMHGKRFLGFLDLQFVEEGEVKIRDWKTRSSFTYAPDDEALLDDIQALCYTWFAFEINPTLDVVTFGHGNMIRVDGKGRPKRLTPRSMLVETVFERDFVYAWYNGRLKTIVEAMGEVAQKGNATEVRPERNSCYQYGPCFYMRNGLKPLRGRTCHEIPYLPMMEKKKEGEKMDLKKLAALRRAKTKAAAKNQTEALAAAPTEETPEPAPVEAREPAPPVKEEKSSGLDAAKAAFLSEGDAFELSAFNLSTEDLRIFVKWRKEQATGEKPSIPAVNPPDAAPDQEPKDLHNMTVQDFDFTKVDGVGKKTSESIIKYLYEEKIDRLAAVLDLTLAGNVPGVGKSTEESIKEAIKACKVWSPEDDVKEEIARAVAKKEEAALSKKAVEKDLVAQQSEEVAEEISVIVESTPYAPPTVLYIDCLPMRGAAAELLDDLLLPLKRQIAKEENVRYWNADRYGAGRRLLVDIVMEDPSFLLNGSVVANSKSEGMDQLLPEIMGYFDIIVRGF